MPTQKKQEKPDQNQELLEIMGQLADSLKNVNVRLDKLETPFTKITTPAPVIKPESTSNMELKDDINKFPIPTEYIDLVHTILNQEFGIKVEPLADRPAFLLTIIVPESYSSLTSEERKIMKQDLRSRVISYAEGSNGVKFWAEKVFTNLGLDIQTRINMERKPKPLSLA